MFDIPPKTSPWFVYAAKLKNGAEVDIFRNEKVSYDRPKSISATISQHHWRRLHRNLVRKSFERFREPVSQYMVRRWNQTHDSDSQIVTAKTTAYLEEIAPGKESDGLITQVWYQHGKEAADEQLFDDLFDKMKKEGVILP